MSSDFVLIVVTTASKTEAETIAQILLSKKLIACANIVGPVASHFHWEGKIEQTEEYLILMKTRADLFSKLEEKVRALHSYEVPEILALPIVKGSEAYLEWLGSVLK